MQVLQKTKISPAFFVYCFTLNELAMKNKKSKKADLENKKGVFFLFGLVISLGMVLLAFQWSTPPKEVIVLKNANYVPDDVLFIPRTKNEEKKELPKPVFLPSFELVGNDTQTDENPDLFVTDPAEEFTVNFNELILTSHQKNVEKEEEIVNFAEVMPEFPGGVLSLQKFIADAVKYPSIALENEIQGKVYVSFVINEFGNVTNATIVRGVDESLDNEALRVIRSLPKWKPGLQGGKAVKVRYFVPINFELH